MPAMGAELTNWRIITPVLLRRSTQKLELPWAGCTIVFPVADGISKNEVGMPMPPFGTINMPIRKMLSEELDELMIA
jgi:hypothetical protein